MGHASVGNSRFVQQSSRRKACVQRDEFSDNGDEFSDNGVFLSLPRPILKIRGPRECLSVACTTTKLSWSFMVRSKIARLGAQSKVHHSTFTLSTLCSLLPFLLLSPLFKRNTFLGQVRSNLKRGGCLFQKSLIKIIGGRGRVLVARN